MRTCECRAGKGSIRRVSPFVSARRVVRSARSAIRPRKNFKRVNYVSHRGDLIRSTKCSQLNRCRD